MKNGSRIKLNCHCVTSVADIFSRVLKRVVDPFSPRMLIDEIHLVLGIDPSPTAITAFAYETVTKRSYRLNSSAHCPVNGGCWVHAADKACAERFGSQKTAHLSKVTNECVNQPAD